MTTTPAAALVLHRRGASMVPLAASEALAAALPAGHLELVDGMSGHLFAEHPDEVAGRVAAFVTDPHAPPPPAWRGPAPPAGAGHRLSRREAEILWHIAAGESNAQIAQLLGLSVNTVERHVTNLYRKIDARSRAHATAYAIRHGLA
ncbi:MAG: response regulator transcription factor [Streptosporangiaceae bacterium]